MSKSKWVSERKQTGVVKKQKTTDRKEREKKKVPRGGCCGCGGLC